MAITGDTFTEATTNTPVDEHTPTGANAGTGWTQHETPGPSADFHALEATNTCAPTSNSDNKNATATLQGDPSNADVDIEFTLSQVYAGAPDASLGLMARRASDTSSYIANLYRVATSPDVTIYTRTGDEAGTQTASGDMSPTAGEVIKFELRGNTKKVYQDDVEIISASSESTITAAGGAGLSGGNSVVSTDDLATSWRIDDFIVTEAAAAGVAPVLRPPLAPYRHTFMR